MPVGKFDLINIGMARRRTLCSSSVHISGTPSLAETQLGSKCTEPPVVCEVSLKKRSNLSARNVREKGRASRKWVNYR